jgi:class 3 adenylate cyclase
MVQEGPVRVERRLSAILAADVAGYSRLMHDDEEATHAKLTTLLSDSVAPTISEHGGRIVKNTCVYRKLKRGRSDGEVRQGWRVI